jgi:hypothetical protein
METVTTNKSNWSGETANVKVSKNLEFTINGDKFQIVDINKMESVTANGGWATLIGEAWDEPLKTLYFLDDKTDLEIVEQAIKWVYNYV